eukprot:TRINITY_DN2945_c1_g1_i1.p1 TRINITY_DN2945_c1_g1~~TRINITY_DN2945_c1_g1_i1.p1  ORF type:complete len:120 (-),score=20.59 TRINITY_DN2945_c1_g1_i1:158-517(-)
MSNKVKQVTDEVKRKFKQSDFQSFEEFFPFYLHEHSNRTNRRLHFVGTSVAMLVLLYVVVMGVPSYFYLLLPLLVGYGCAWVGHFVFQKNKPATFKYPIYSLRGDFRMWKMIVTGEVPF